MLDELSIEFVGCVLSGAKQHEGLDAFTLDGIGDADDWTPAADCRQLAQAAGAAPLLSLIVYPGAHHSFDSDRPLRYVAERINPSAPSGRGATTAGNAEAWADSIRQVDAFFAKYLKN